MSADRDELADAYSNVRGQLTEARAEIARWKGRWEVEQAAAVLEKERTDAEIARLKLDKAVDDVAFTSMNGLCVDAELRVSALEAENARLNAENEKLRKGEIEIEECAEALTHREVEKQWQAQLSALTAEHERLKGETLKVIREAHAFLVSVDWTDDTSERNAADIIALLDKADDALSCDLSTLQKGPQ